MFDFHHSFQAPSNNNHGQKREGVAHVRVRIVSRLAAAWKASADMFSRALPFWDGQVIAHNQVRSHYIQPYILIAAKPCEVVLGLPTYHRDAKVYGARSWLYNYTIL